MPGKINPTVPEMVIQIAHQICGNDVAITMAVDEGELDTIMRRFSADVADAPRQAKTGEPVRRDGGKLLFYTNSVDFRLVRICDICVFIYDHVCRFFPPFDNIDYVKVGRFFRRKLINRYNSL